MSAARDAMRRRFLARAGWRSAGCRPVEGDASARRYFRLSRGKGRAILMDSPPEAAEKVEDFIAVTALLRERGLSAPDIYLADRGEGFLLLEDLGAVDFAALLHGEPSLETTLYETAVDLLDVLAIDAPASPLPLPPYDGAALWAEASLLVDWWVPGATGVPMQSALRDEYASLMQGAMKELATRRDALTLRDYHAQNLVWMPARRGVARVGLLDYQDARTGVAEYDLISLLEDARRDLAAGRSGALMQRWLARFPKGEREAALLRASLLAAQRNAKILGIFARLSMRDGKPRYLTLMPRVWAHFMRDLGHPALRSLHAWVKRHIPPPGASALERVRAMSGARAAPPSAFAAERGEQTIP